MDSPVEESREFPLYPSPPASPYSKHRSNSIISGEEKSYGDRPPPKAACKFIPDEEAPWPKDFSVPSPSSCRSSTTTSRSTTPSDTPEGSLNGSTERLNNLEDDQSAEKCPNTQSIPTVVTEVIDSNEDMVPRKERAESNISGSSIPVTFIGSETEDDREITVIDVSSSPTQTPQTGPQDSKSDVRRHWYVVLCNHLMCILSIAVKPLGNFKGPDRMTNILCALFMFWYRQAMKSR